jgi:hypothetical protein
MQGHGTHQWALSARAGIPRRSNRGWRCWQGEKTTTVGDGDDGAHAHTPPPPPTTHPPVMRPQYQHSRAGNAAGFATAAETTAQGPTGHAPSAHNAACPLHRALPLPRARVHDAQPSPGVGGRVKQGLRLPGWARVRAVGARPTLHVPHGVVLVTVTHHTAHPHIDAAHFAHRTPHIPHHTQRASSPTLARSLGRCGRQWRAHLRRAQPVNAPTTAPRMTHLDDQPVSWPRGGVTPGRRQLRRKRLAVRLVLDGEARQLFQTPPRPRHRKHAHASTPRHAQPQRPCEARMYSGVQTGEQTR